MRNDWKDEIHAKAFRDLKHAFTNAPLLAIPELFEPYRIIVDTCTTYGRGIGAILCQLHGEIHMIQIRRICLVTIGVLLCIGQSY